MLFKKNKFTINYIFLKILIKKLKLKEKTNIFLFLKILSIFPFKSILKIFNFIFKYFNVIKILKFTFIVSIFKN